MHTPSEYDDHTQSVGALTGTGANACPSASESVNSESTNGSPAQMLAALRAANRYEVGTVIARGGMGAILNAKEASIERIVAMKVVLDANNPTALSRFVTEAKVTGQLEHPNIVPVHELGVDEKQQVFYTMKFVKGVTLRLILEKLSKGDAETVKEYPLAALLTILQKVCDAMAFAHSKGVIHRDLKPENIMIGKYGEVLVMDWGLAKILGQAEPESKNGSDMISPSATATGTQTMAGAVLGTLAYMAPEQATGQIEKMDARSDIYALGGILYHILALRSAIDARVARTAMMQVSTGAIVPPEKAVGPTRKLSHLPGGRIPESLSAVAMKALALAQNDRYPSVPELQRDVEAYQNGFATSAEHAGVIKQVTLLVKRNKGIFATAFAAWFVITALLAWFVISLRDKEDRAVKGEQNAKDEAARAKEAEAAAVRTLADLRRTAPVFYAQAKVDFEDGHLAAALDKIGYAIQLDDTNADYRLFRANLRESSQDIAAAAEDYRRVLALRPADAAAQANLALCEKLRGETGAAPLGKAQQNQLLTALREQKRLIEAAPLAAILDPDAALARSALLARLHEARTLPGWKDDKGVIALPDGTFKVSLNGLAPIDFSVLKGQPVSALDLGGTGIEDLSSLAGLPLKELILANTRAADLSPLRGMPLESLYLESAPVADLSPLRGMKLRTLNLYRTKITDLGPLAGMPLTFLNCDDCPNLKDISPLKGVPLVNLILINTPVTSIAPLVGAPLKYLALDGVKITDFTLLSQFEGMERLSLCKLPITDLAPLAKMHLTSLDCRFTKITSIEPLRGQPLRFLNLGQCHIADLSPLADCATLEEFVPPYDYSDLTPIRKLLRLKRISSRVPLANGAPPWYADQPAEEYWKKYDAMKAALQAAGGWEDILAQLTPAEVARIGQGWSLKDGQLFSPDTIWARLQLPCVLSGASYQVRIKLRRLTAKDTFHVIIPVGDSMAGFELDGFEGNYTGLQLVNGQKGKDVPGIVEGKQVKDSEPHELEVSVRLDGANAAITAKLDTRVIGEWIVPTAALSQNPRWAIEPGFLGLGSFAANWMVSEVKVRRLENKP